MAIREVVEVEAGVEVVVIEVVGVGVEAEVDGVDTALRPGARSGNPQVPTPFLWDRSRFLFRLLTFVVRILRCRLPNTSLLFTDHIRPISHNHGALLKKFLTASIYSLSRTTSWTTLIGLSYRQELYIQYPPLHSDWLILIICMFLTRE